MIKNATIVILLVLLLGSNCYWSDLLEHADSHSSLEVRIRDITIEEMASIIKHNYQGLTKQQLVESLSDSFGNEPIDSEGQMVEFRSLKFKFENDALQSVH